MAQEKGSGTVAVVVLTYNRKDLLKEVLRALEVQTRPVDAIYLIDNHSSDGTRAMLEAEGFLKNSVIKYRPMASNLGCAAGFREGMKAAYDDGHEWIWTMDDDVAPMPQGLFSLLAHQKDCVQSGVAAEGKLLPWIDRMDFLSGKTLSSENSAFTKFGKSEIIVNSCSFEGLFLRRTVVAKAGYPDPLFFIQSDDAAYGMVLSLFTNIYYYPDVVLRKLIIPKDYQMGGITFSGQSAVKIYYSIRNSFLFEQVCRLCYKDVPLNRTISHRRTICLRILKILFYSIFLADQKFASFSAVCRGVKDGIRDAKKVKIPVF